MLIRGDGGKRLMGGNRIRTGLALSVRTVVRVRQAGVWQSVSALPGGTCQWRNDATLRHTLGSHTPLSVVDGDDAL